MTAQSKIVEIGRSQSDSSPSEYVVEEQVEVQQEFADAPASEEYLESEWHDVVESGRPWGKILLLIALISATLGWTGFFIWAHLPELIVVPDPARISELIVQWSAPVAVIGLLWLLSMRMSSTEAKRFGDVAALLRSESDALQNRMRNVNGEIALARSFLAENAKELEAIGRLSAQRLTEAATQLSAALTDSDERAKMLQVASNAAVTNLEQLRNHLPVVTSAAKDATNQIGIAGNTAHSQIQAIIGVLKTMDESAANANISLEALDTRISASTSALNQKLSAASADLSQSVEQSGKLADDMLTALSSGVTEAEQRLIETANQLDDRMAASHQRLEGNLGSLGEAIAHLEAVSDAQDSTSKALLARVKESIAESRNELSKFGDEASDSIAKLAFSVSALNERSEELDGRLKGTLAQTDALIEQAGAMRSDLEAIADETTERLVSKLDNVNAMFVDVRTAFSAANNELAIADEGTGALVRSVQELEQLVSTQRSALASLNESSSEYLTAQHEQVDILSAAIVHTRTALEELSGIANEQLVASLLRVRETTKQAAEASRKIVDEELSVVADKLNERNRVAIETAVDEQVKALDVAMREAFGRNLTLAADVEERIEAQLKLVGEMATNLEQRVNEAHSSFAGIDDEGFARRMALLTESLNSAAIDVAKILSNEVTDTAWAAYLKGDRGVFTRRAVRLLDSGEAKIIAAHYDDDAEFREHVNRYIHDFESMMRVLLSTRDGNAIGVTLLSSDVGKLYVALAQAIERLRG
ncbi:hypothetical protein [uncultured Sphingorhabdus sp.]|uniref:hypothetical protein n=1 Tax=uncultured Sphingorhabdus sp. TaxID=1686106 RepID=UPI002632586D|nr:hypothetical protein [uncultured Sphingorhabdus sp.]HMS18982.1 hypothetical protein [Sphingorhabdus sp.]